jgi:hypothetical protein
VWQIPVLIVSSVSKLVLRPAPLNSLENLDTDLTLTRGRNLDSLDRERLAGLPRDGGLAGDGLE